MNTIDREQLIQRITVTVDDLRIASVNVKRYWTAPQLERLQLLNETQGMLGFNGGWGGVSA